MRSKRIFPGWAPELSISGGLTGGGGFAADALGGGQIPVMDAVTSDVHLHISFGGRGNCDASVKTPTEYLFALVFVPSCKNDRPQLFGRGSADGGETLSHGLQPSKYTEQGTQRSRRAPATGGGPGSENVDLGERASVVQWSAVPFGSIVHAGTHPSHTYGSTAQGRSTYEHVA